MITNAQLRTLRNAAAILNRLDDATRAHLQDAGAQPDSAAAALNEIVDALEKSTPATVPAVNRAIKYMGLTLRAARAGNSYLGYYYFVNSKGDQVGDSVYVYRCGQQPVSQWIRDAEAAIEQNRKSRR